MDSRLGPHARIVVCATLAVGVLISRSTWAADAGPPPAAVDSPPIPPNAEAAPVAAPTGGYCYEGPHPVDTRVAPGAPWDPTEGRHLRPYPPFDVRLFAFRNGCYQFVGDPRDFGYTGPTHSYWGAHPVQDTHGGGWCFIVGGHNHRWQPWHNHFVVAGSWYYWQGAYDPVFWAYWPYWSVYYRSYYPRYYGEGRFYRNHHAGVAPAIRHVPAPAAGMWRASPAGMPMAPTRGFSDRGGGRDSWAAQGWRGNPAASPGFGSSPAAPRPGSYPRHEGWRAQPGGTGWGGGVSPGPSFQGGSPSGGGFRGAPSAPSRGGGGGGGWRGTPR